MKDIKKQVESTLRSYTSMKKQVQVLEFELGRITPALKPDVIESIIYSHSGLERVSSSHVSDKTSDIAVDHVDSQRNSEYHALRDLIHTMHFELRRVEYYLSLIPEEEATAIKLFYFEGLSWNKISEITFSVQRTAQRRKNRGFDKLVSFYSLLDNLDAKNIDARIRARFISYIHEERFVYCLKLVGKDRKPGTTAMLYILSGCNEIWQEGVETFFDFGTGETICFTESKSPLSDNGRKLLRLAYHFASGLDDDLIHVLRYYFSGLEFVDLELAIEAIKLALFS